MVRREISEKVSSNQIIVGALAFSLEIDGRPDKSETERRGRCGHHVINRRSIVAAGESNDETVPSREHAAVAGRFVVAKVATKVQQFWRAILG